ncbi:MAG: restriction endonuclease subunit S [Dermatophilaceae bacterium]
MKPGWTSVALGDVAQVVSGATPKTGVAKYWDGKIPWVTPKDLSTLKEAEIHVTPRNITEAGLRSCAAAMLPAGSVLFSSRAPIGHVAINSVPMATNQGFKSLVPREGVLDAKYLYHWLRWNRSFLESLGNGATFKEVSKAVVSRVELPLPPIEEQRRIATILDHADALAAMNQAALESLGRTYGALSQRLVPQGSQDVVDLGDVAEVQGGLQITSRRSALPKEVPYLRVANVGRGSIDCTEIKTLRVTQLELDRVRLRREDLLLVEGHGNPGEVGRAARWTGADADMVHQNHLIRVRANESAYLPVVLEALINSTVGRDHFARSGKTTSGLNTISTTNVRSLRLPLLTRPRQEDFA